MSEDKISCPCTYCGEEVDPRRVKILKKAAIIYDEFGEESGLKPYIISCLDCASGKVAKVTGFQVNNDKACREIQVCSPEEGARLMKMQRKGGQATGGPGVGVNAGKIVYKG